MDTKSKFFTVLLAACLLIPLVAAVDPQISANNMTSNATAGFTANRSSISLPAYEASYAFDGTTGDNGWQSDSTYIPAWVGQYIVNSKNLTSYTIYPFSVSTYAPKDWTIEGSNTSFSGPWTVVDTRSGVTSWSGSKSYTVTGSPSFRYYRMNITATNGGAQAIIDELYLYGVTYTPSVALSPNFTSNVSGTIYKNDYVQFNDTSLGSPTSWNWTLAPGAYSTLQNPVRQYTTTGSYNITLKVFNATANSSITRNYYLNVTVVPAPSEPTFTGNKTYSTGSGSFVVDFFVTSAPPPAMTNYTMTWGDGGSTTYTGGSFGNISHTYSSVDEFSPSLRVFNTNSSATTTNTNMIILTRPKISIIQTNTSINRGSNATTSILLQNLTRVDGFAANITFNQSLVSVNTVTTNTSGDCTGFSLTYSTSPGVLSVGGSLKDLTTDVCSPVDIVWRATAEPTNITAPLNFSTSLQSTFVKSNSSYSVEKYPNFTLKYPAQLYLTNNTFTRNLLFQNAYNLNLVEGIQVRITWTGDINGSASTNTGQYPLANTYGTTSVTASADGYYNVTQDVTFDDNGDDIFLMTPLSGAPGQTTWYSPLQVKLNVMNLVGTPLGGVLVTATPLDFTAPEDWAQILIGIQPSVNITGTSVSGYTGTDGSWVAPMLQSQRYRFTFTNSSTGLNEVREFYPSDLKNNVYLEHPDGIILTNRNSTYSNLNGTRRYVVEPNISYVSMCIDYIDVSGQTTSVTDTWLFMNNNTVIKEETFSPGVSMVTKCHTIKNIRGTEIWWSYNATREVKL